MPATATGSTHHARPAGGRHAGGQPDPGDNADRRPPVVADDELPPESPERSHVSHVVAATGGAGRRRSTVTSAAETRDDECEHAEDRRIRARPVRAGALGRPERAEGREHHADGELHGVLGHRGQRGANEHPGTRDHDERRRRPARGERDAPLRAAERQHDEGHLQPLEQHPLEREHEPVEVEARAHLDVRSPRLLELVRERGLLVVQRLEAARAQDRLPQPLQSEGEQQPADDQPQPVQRDQRQRRTERRHDHREHDGRRGSAGERRPPAARQTRSEHDRQRFDHLDRAGQEGRENEEDGAQAPGA